MIKKIRNILSITITIVLVLSMFVTSSHATDKSIYISCMDDFFSNYEFAVKKLNEVSSASVDEENTISLYNGNTIKTEKRVTPINEDVSLINIRIEENEVSPRARKTVTDKYGLLWGGYEGADGWLIAKYTYDYTTIHSPNDMITTIYSAGGTTESLGSGVNLKRIDAGVDLATGYRASAHATFTISQSVQGFESESFDYKNTITFNSYGAYKLSW